MTLGVTVTTRLSPPSRGTPVQTDTLFVPAFTSATIAPPYAEVTDIASFETKVGTRTAGNTALWDAMDLYFREGGKRALIAKAATDSATDCLLALGNFPKTLGAGQVMPAGFVAADPNALIPIAIAGHCQSNNRVGLIPMLDSTIVGDITTWSAKIKAVDPDGFVAIFGPYVNVPAPKGVVGGAARTLPITPVIAGLIARVDQLGNPNQAAAGRSLPFQYVTSLKTYFTDTDRETLLNAGVNTAAEVFGVLENYGFQTTVVFNVDSPYWQFNCSRTRMALVAQAALIGETYMFRPIDGRGLVTNSLRASLEAMLLGYYQGNALFGETPSDAFYVDTGPSVNTITTIAAGKLRAVASVCLSLHAKSIEIELVSVPAGGQI